LITSVSADDDMMEWGNPERYFLVGRWSPIAGIERGLVAARRFDPTRILDLPSGYGRVMRYLKVTWRSAELTACDIMPGAVEFCAKTFGARAIVSQEPVWEVNIGTGYDLIWSGSLLTISMPTTGNPHFITSPTHSHQRAFSSSRPRDAALMPSCRAVTSSRR
jgi:hypothetical protein